MEPICFHAKRVNKRYIALIDVLKNEEDADLREEAAEMIANWPKTHTFCVKNDEDALRVTWSKVNTGSIFEKGDTFCKKTGKQIALDKMTRLVSNPPRTMYDLNAYNSVKQTLCEEEGLEYTPSKLREFLFMHLPACVADSLSWHINRAVRYYKINDNKLVIIEGSTEREDSDIGLRDRVAIVSDTESILKL